MHSNTAFISVLVIILLIIEHNIAIAKPNSIPRSTNSRSIDPAKIKDLKINEQSTQAGDRNIDSLPPWNLSPRIDSDGFLTELYQRVHGEWESDPNGGYSDDNEAVGGKFFGLHEPVYVRQVPGDGNCLFHSIAVSLALIENRTHIDMTLSGGQDYQDVGCVDEKKHSFESTHETLPSTHLSKIHKKSRRYQSYSSDSVRRGPITIDKLPHQEYVHDLSHLHHLSRCLRGKAVEILSQKPRKLLFLQGNEYLRARDLVIAAASQYDLSAEEYCEQMKNEGCWGGGPEILAICNFLKRPIHVYELSDSCHETPDYINEESEDNSDGLDSSNNHEQHLLFDIEDGDSDTSAVSTTIQRQKVGTKIKELKTTINSDLERPKFRFRRMACFGSPKFDRRQPLHILSADSRFPDVEPGKQLSCGNHFLALFPESLILRVIPEQEKRLRETNIGGGNVRGGSASALRGEGILFSAGLKRENNTFSTKKKLFFERVATEINIICGIFSSLWREISNYLKDTLFK